MTLVRLLQRCKVAVGLLSPMESAVIVLSISRLFPTCYSFNLGRMEDRNFLAREVVQSIVDHRDQTANQPEKRLDDGDGCDVEDLAEVLSSCEWKHRTRIWELVAPYTDAHSSLDCVRGLTILGESLLLGRQFSPEYIGTRLASREPKATSTLEGWQRRAEEQLGNANTPLHYRVEYAFATAVLVGVGRCPAAILGASYRRIGGSISAAVIGTTPVGVVTKLESGLVLAAASLTDSSNPYKGATVAAITSLIQKWSELRSVSPSDRSAIRLLLHALALGEVLEAPRRSPWLQTIRQSLPFWKAVSEKCFHSERSIEYLQDYLTAIRKLNIKHAFVLQRLAAAVAINLEKLLEVNEFLRPDCVEDLGKLFLDEAGDYPRDVLSKIVRLLIEHCDGWLKVCGSSRWFGHDRRAQEQIIRWLGFVSVLKSKVLSRSAPQLILKTAKGAKHSKLVTVCSDAAMVNFLTREVPTLMSFTELLLLLDLVPSGDDGYWMYISKQIQVLGTLARSQTTQLDLSVERFQTLLGILFPVLPTADALQPLMNVGKAVILQEDSTPESVSALLRFITTASSRVDIQPLFFHLKQASRLRFD